MELRAYETTVVDCPRICHRPGCFTKSVQVRDCGDCFHLEGYFRENKAIVGVRCNYEPPMERRL